MAYPISHFIVRYSYLTRGSDSQCAPEPYGYVVLTTLFNIGKVSAARGRCRLRKCTTPHHAVFPTPRGFLLPITQMWSCFSAPRNLLLTSSIARLQRQSAGAVNNFHFFPQMCFPLTDICCVPVRRHSSSYRDKSP